MRARVCAAAVAGARGYFCKGTRSVRFDLMNTISLTNTLDEIDKPTW